MYRNELKKTYSQHTSRLRQPPRRSRFFSNFVGQFMHGIDLENSMGHHYVSFPSDNSSKRAFPMRVWSAGLLLSVGKFLYSYEGFGGNESVALNLGVLVVLGVSLFPMNRDCGQDRPPVNLLWRRLE